jgi:hypothetical protein
MDTKVKNQPAARELAPRDAPLNVAVAPGVLDRQHTVIREPNESDESYRFRCELLARLTSYVKGS